MGDQINEEELRKLTLLSKQEQTNLTQLHLLISDYEEHINDSYTDLKEVSDFTTKLDSLLNQLYKHVKKIRNLHGLVDEFYNNHNKKLMNKKLSEVSSIEDAMRVLESELTITMQEIKQVEALLDDMEKVLSVIDNVDTTKLIKETEKYLKEIFKALDKIRRVSKTHLGDQK
jgi:cysteinyl-tRNA synthetase